MKFTYSFTVYISTFVSGLEIFVLLHNKGKKCLWLLMVIRHRATERRLPYGITRVTWHPTQVNASRFNSSQTGWIHSIHLPRKDGRLSWPWWLLICRDGLPACPQIVTNLSSNYMIATRPEARPVT